MSGVTSKILQDGTLLWYKDFKLHRDGDEPALITSDGRKEWYKEGMLHREGDKPAVIWEDGTRIWYKEGLKHRDNDEPALIWADGVKEWYKNGERYFLSIEAKKNEILKLCKVKRHDTVFKIKEVADEIVKLLEPMDPVDRTYVLKDVDQHTDIAREVLFYFIRQTYGA